MALALLTDPTGGRLGMTVDQLPAWPLLDDYLVPGIALIVLFGLLPIAAAGAAGPAAPRGWTATAAVGAAPGVLVGRADGRVGLAFPTVQVGFLIVGIVLTGLGVDGGASVGATDESRDAVRSYEYADDDP